MGYITGWIVVGIITLGIYKLFELFVGKKERLTMIEKLGDKLDPSMLGNRLSLPLPVGTPFMSSSPISFSALKFGCLLLGMGLGLLTGYIICATTVPDYFTERNWRMSELTSLIYGANVLLFGGLGLVVAFIVELKISQKNKLIACGAGVDSLGVQWAVDTGNKELADSLNNWFKPNMLAEIKKEESYLLSSNSVKRHVYAPFLNRAGGVISHYDPLFKKYAPVARWDWRLMAAQCYQESCFDPQARSWAGARGLMQIMPATASHLGLAMSDIHDPEKNISAAARYINELTGYFRNIPSSTERQLFVLASYNGGYFHVQDAMALARKNGKSPYRWRDVAYYILALEQPQYYNDPVVKYGYMRGSETVDYVDRIRQRYAQYRGVPYGGASVKGWSGGASAPSFSPMPPPKAKNRHRFHI